ncbi:MAG: hypothetical protein IKU44_03055, partial [Firmicutes bacterium]|nr:hypothetical protein [Bacillota bacterium]
MNFRNRGKKWIALLLAATLVTTSFGVVPASYGAADKEGPKVDLNSIKLNKQKITNRKEAPTVKIKVTDNTGVHSVCLFYEIPGKWHNSGPAGVMLENNAESYNKATGYFEGTIDYSCEPIGGDVFTRIGYYGKYRLKQITAVDFYGNETVLTDLDVPQANFEVVGGNP